MFANAVTNSRFMPGGYMKARSFIVTRYTLLGLAASNQFSGCAFLFFLRRW
jgi:hypothetical protein